MSNICVVKTAPISLVTHTCVANPSIARAAPGSDQIMGVNWNHTMRFEILDSRDLSILVHQGWVTGTAEFVTPGSSVVTLKAKKDWY